MYRSRFETVQHTDIVRLTAEFYDTSGDLVDLDSFPKISIIQPSGEVLLAPTSAGVAHVATGVYEYDLSVGINYTIGIWRDQWTGTLDGNDTARFNGMFAVIDTNLPGVNSDGYVALGDDPGFNYSQDAIRNINSLLKLLRARLNSSGKAKATDKYGNTIYVECNIFSVDMLVTFLADSLSHFNEIPLTTAFTFDDFQFVNLYGNVLVQGAALYALSSKALIERGREFVISDNGINFTPPGVSDIMSTQWSAEISNHTEKLKMIKQNMRSAPLGLGTLNIMVARNPVISQLRHRRARQII